jgi:hypothetical protein
MKVLGNSRGWATVRWLFLALTAIWTASMSGQTTATVTPITYAEMFWLPGSLVAIIGLGRRKGKRSEWRGSFFWTIAILVLIGVGAISGCAGSFKFVKPGTYTIPISLTLSGGSTQTVNATVVVD